ncbi:M16 family metallopeptidase [Streptomyces sp. NPDC093250]|uniref:M16 family metallopeptidase n=1 Tax=Streptomyces sp. NPDC093250 TaxID=3366036 RepID=UPI00380FD3FD
MQRTSEVPPQRTIAPGEAQETEFLRCSQRTRRLPMVTSMPIPILRRLTLPNGLRALLCPMPGVPAVGVSVHYDVGFRSEPEGRTGFAHLFEHLMFQGSESVDRMEHFRRVQAAGGAANGSTHQDYTDYYQVVPSAALERVLFLEADRMRAPKLTPENLRTQLDVVKEEIRLNVLNKPYGGFPWTVLPGLLYTSYPNSHNGYGDFCDLEQATVDECARFFDTYYAPGNAVLTIAGGFDPDRAADLVHRHFHDIVARSTGPAVDLWEPPPTGELRGEHPDPHAPLPATAVGYRMPDARTEVNAYLAHMVLSSILTGGDASRLKQRLIHRSPTVTDVSTGCGLFGALEARDPDTFLCVATHPAQTTTNRFLELLDEELEDLAARGPRDDELARATALSAVGTHRAYDSLPARTRALGTQELLFGRAEIVGELADRLAGVTAEDVALAAKGLQPGRRAVLSLRPAAAMADHPVQTGS